MSSTGMVYTWYDPQTWMNTCRRGSGRTTCHGQDTRRLGHTLTSEIFVAVDKVNGRYLAFALHISGSLGFRGAQAMVCGMKAMRAAGVATHRNNGHSHHPLGLVDGEEHIVLHSCPCTRETLYLAGRKQTLYLAGNKPCTPQLKTTFSKSARKRGWQPPDPASQFKKRDIHESTGFRFGSLRQTFSGCTATPSLSKQSLQIPCYSAAFTCTRFSLVAVLMTQLVRHWLEYLRFFFCFLFEWPARP